MKKFDYKKLRLTDDYEYESEEEEKQTDKKLDKKEPPKKPTESRVKELNKLINKKETDMNKELFQKYFNFRMSSTMLRELFRTNNKRKNKELVNLTKSGLSDLKEDIEQISESEIEIKKTFEMRDIVERILEFNIQNQEGQGIKNINSRTNA